MDDYTDLLDAVRGYLFPRINDTLHRTGNQIDTPLYSLRTSDRFEYVGRLPAPPDEVEYLIKPVAAYNPIAAYKVTEPDGVGSVGSWRVTDLPELRHDEQLHITLHPGGKHSTDVYAHVESDYMDDPIGHLHGEGFRPDLGVELAADILADQGLFPLPSGRYNDHRYID